MNSAQLAVLAAADAAGRPLLAIVIEASFAADGAPLPGDPISLDGAWHGDPACSSPRLAPCGVPARHGVDVLLAGTADGAEVAFACGPVAAAARVRGRRTWVRRWCGVRPGPEAARGPVPLRWEEACGPQPANPVGCGLAERFAEGLPLPRLELPDHPLRRFGRAVPPAGFAATTPAWAHRRDRAAFDPLAANCAAPGLIAAAMPRAAAFALDGCGAPWRGRLPDPPPPRLRVARRQGDLAPEPALEQVRFDADARTITLGWRALCDPGEHGWVTAVELA
jgi:hypothetical protein